MFFASLLLVLTEEKGERGDVSFTSDNPHQVAHWHVWCQRAGPVLALTAPTGGQFRHLWCSQGVPLGQ